MLCKSNPTTIGYKQSDKVTFCPGPGAVLDEWHLFQKPLFGRGDPDFQEINSHVSGWIQQFVGQDKQVVPITGSGSTAGVIALRAFISGAVFVLNTGYYSKRWYDQLVIQANVRVELIDICQITTIKAADWIVGVHVETASAKKFDVEEIYSWCKSNGINFILDSTASVGLESNCHACDVTFFSSCKGLLGPTGAGFIAYRSDLQYAAHHDFLHNMDNHINPSYTLPYNTLSALYCISQNHQTYVERINYARSFLFHALSVKGSLRESSATIGLGAEFDSDSEAALKKVLTKSIYYQPRLNPGYRLFFFLGLIIYEHQDIEKCLVERVLNIGRS